LIGDDREEGSLPGDFNEGDQKLVYKYGRNASQIAKDASAKEINTVPTVAENN
tara:strand:+ start:86 stop:244 length:159 start_codon:yes stop_codon:yes gene_type:complete